MLDSDSVSCGMQMCGSLTCEHMTMQSNSAVTITVVNVCLYTQVKHQSACGMMLGQIATTFASDAISYSTDFPQVRTHLSHSSCHSSSPCSPHSSC